MGSGWIFCGRSETGLDRIYIGTQSSSHHSIVVVFHPSSCPRSTRRFAWTWRASRGFRSEWKSDRSRREHFQETLRTFFTSLIPTHGLIQTHVIEAPAVKTKFVCLYQLRICIDLKILKLVDSGFICTETVGTGSGNDGDQNGVGQGDVNMAGW